MQRNTHGGFLTPNKHLRNVENAHKMTLDPLNLNIISCRLQM